MIKDIHEYQREYIYLSRDGKLLFSQNVPLHALINHISVVIQKDGEYALYSEPEGFVITTVKNEEILHEPDMKKALKTFLIEKGKKIEERRKNISSNDEWVARKSKKVKIAFSRNRISAIGNIVTNLNGAKSSSVNRINKISNNIASISVGAVKTGKTAERRRKSDFDKWREMVEQRNKMQGNLYNQKKFVDEYRAFPRVQPMPQSICAECGRTRYTSQMFHLAGRLLCRQCYERLIRQRRGE